MVHPINGTQEFFIRNCHPEAVIQELSSRSCHPGAVIRNTVGIRDSVRQYSPAENIPSPTKFQPDIIFAGRKKVVFLAS